MKISLDASSFDEQVYTQYPIVFYSILSQLIASDFTEFKGSLVCASAHFSIYLQFSPFHAANNKDAKNASDINSVKRRS